MNNAIFRDIVKNYGVAAGEIHFAAFNELPVSYRTEADNLISAIFDLEPEEAVKYLQAKGYAITFDWAELSAKAQQEAFTVAKVTRLDILQDIKNALVKAQQAGSTLEQFKKDIKPTLEAKGWGGRKEITLKDGTKANVNLTPSRLETIYRTNLQSAYNAGTWQRAQDTKDTRPFMQFLAIIDESTSETCSQLNRKVFEVDDPIWDTITPPLHHNCRSTVRTLSAKQMLREGLSTESLDAATLDIPESFRRNPGKQSNVPDLSKYDADLESAARQK